MARLGRSFPAPITHLFSPRPRAPRTVVATLQDLLTLSDSLDRIFIGGRSLTDALTLTESLGQIGEFNRTLQDALIFADTLGTTLTTAPTSTTVSLLESLNLTDQLTETFFDAVLWVCIDAASETWICITVPDMHGQKD